MGENQDNKEELSDQPHTQSQTQNDDEKEEEKEPPSQDDVNKILKNILKNTESVKENTSSETNVKALERIEKGIEKLGEAFQAVISAINPLPQNHDKEPETPEIETEMPPFTYIRKRGGRVVKRVDQKKINENKGA